MSVMQKLEITHGHPFEYEWEIDYDIFGEDKIDSTIPFEIKNKNGEVVYSLEFNYGMTIAKFDDEEKSRLVISIFETDMLDEGTYTFDYHPVTLSGNKIGDMSGEIIVSTKESDTIPKITRDVRPWDLLRSKSPGSAGERVSFEEKEKRMSICQECPRFVKLTSQCLECGCIMNLKTKLAAATCPLGKW